MVHKVNTASYHTILPLIATFTGYSLNYNDTYTIFTFLRTYLITMYFIVPDDLLYKAGTTYPVHSEKLPYSCKATYPVIFIIFYISWFSFIKLFYCFYCSHLLYYLYYVARIIELHIINN